ncbi:saccharopine dehydrogenase family protein [Synergistes jonesii]|uniref:Saccharopine dehydrogenase n=1 Tax=Synergistes jonesii TaxID=2754 RepID=A0A073J0N2_9BACT|nr:saccharopine dehydrogenase C-terminal domain-containing protein [Synergistes jonesii]KEJ91247.1 hypothetical protein EH55_11895 [Synergistes jonesii]OFB60335.1 hypothetical protein JS73_12735 [Synergistes jonesii]OFB65639.1 hypothetical protein JS72_01320 [Synergistes jonesii]OFB66200.1 hypothetical protein JS79_03520 [Synergistes jonesii]OFB66535.1 hypothetical protein JS78_12755 [Synergistes jonesii]
MNMKKKALLMGFGLQGHGALYDLIKFGDFEEIRVLDNREDLEEALNKFDSVSPAIVPIKGTITDRPLLESAIRGVDIVICLLPRDFALPMAELAVEMGTNYTCASYMGNFCNDEESRQRQKKRLEKLACEAKRKKITVLTQCGLDPGLDLLLAGEAVRQYDSVEDFISYGAGFPDIKAADNPISYKFTWTVEGVMRSYYRPARIIKDSKVVDIEPGEIFFDKNIHTLSIDELGGVLECFPNGDSAALAEELGIRNQVRSMGRYVCRWKGHCAFWRVFANCGFLKDEKVTVHGVSVDKIPFIAAILSAEPQFFYKDDEQDVTLTRVDVKGMRGGKKVRIIYQIIDKKDLTSGYTSMTRTVGFVVSMGAMMALNGELGEGGMITPVEMPFIKTVKELEKRGIIVTHKEYELDE